MSPATPEQDGQLRLSGELDAQSVPRLIKDTDGWLRSSDRDLTVDLSAVERADSAGVALLLDLQRRAQAANRNIRFANPPQQMQAIIGFCALDNVLDLA